MITADIIAQYLKSIDSPKNILVAYSGGLDSHVLLHLFSQLSNYHVRAMHIHHGLLDEADAWVKHCERICCDLNIDLQIEYLGLKVGQGESLEEVARTARYKALKSSLYTHELLVTAHHQNDQTETLLLQLFRGAGVNGLAAMPTYSRANTHARPLLAESRQALETYAKEHCLNYINDPSNLDTSFDRNYLRNQVLPLLRKRWKGLDKAINRSATIQGETKQLLDEIAEQDLKKVSTKGNRIDLSELAQFSPNRQKLLLRFWIVKSGFLVPSETKLKHIFNDVIEAGDDAQPVVEWSGAEIRRFKYKLSIMSPLSKHDMSQEFIWNIARPLQIESLSMALEFSALGFNADDFLDDKVVVRFRQGGDRIFISKRGINISLKNLMQELDVPPWIRPRLPLIVINDEIVKIVGIEL